MQSAALGNGSLGDGLGGGGGGSGDNVFSCDRDELNVMYDNTVTTITVIYLLSGILNVMVRND